jgi:hypothetical protein
MMMMMRKALLVALILVSAVTSFVPNSYHHGSSPAPSRRNDSSRLRSSTFEVTIDLPPTTSLMKARLNIDSILSVPTELIVVRYRLPFGLNVEPVRGLAVVTQPGTGGERPGDILRYCTQWTLGMPTGESLSNTFASFAGELKWQCTIFDVIKAKAWEQVVNALTSNIMERTDEVVLIFERPIDGVIPPELQ